jgi:hypothetical protein
MKVKSRAKPQAFPTDSILFRRAMARLEASGMVYHRPTGYLLKVAHWNYYPDSQTLQRDGDKKIPEPQSLDRFIERLEQDVSLARTKSLTKPINLTSQDEN